MGDLEFGRGDGFVAVKENVYVEEARAFGEFFFATELQFDFAKGAQQIEWGQRCFSFGDAVEEPGLVEIIDRFGLVEGRDSCDSDGWGKRADGAAQIPGAVAKIGTKGEVDRFEDHCVTE